MAIPFVDSLLKKLPSSLGSLASFGGSSPDSVIGLDIGSSAIKVVQIKRKGGRPVLETYGEIALGPYGGVEIGRATALSEDKIVEAIKDLLREANVTARSAAVAFPLSSSLISLVPMPKLPESRMNEMIPIEARRYIPVSISDVTLDWWVIPEEEKIFSAPAGSRASDGKTQKEEGKVDVLLVAILNEAIGKYNRIVRDAELVDPIFEIEAFSTIRSTVTEGIEPILIFDMGAGNTKIYLVHHGLIKDSHNVNRGSQDITLALARSMNIPVERAEELKRTVGLSTDPSNQGVSEASTLILDYIFAEANRALLSFEKKYGKAISKVILSGGGSAMKGLEELARLRFSAPVEKANPFARLVTPPFLGDILTMIGPEFSVAIGVALRKLTG